MYVALKALRVMDGPGKVKTLQVGDKVDVTGWSARVMRAHLGRRLIEKVSEEDQQKIEFKTTKADDSKKKKRGRPKKTEADESLSAS